MDYCWLYVWALFKSASLKNAIFQLKARKNVSTIDEKQFAYGMFYKGV